MNQFRGHSRTIAPLEPISKACLEDLGSLPVITKLSTNEDQAAFLRKMNEIRTKKQTRIIKFNNMRKGGQQHSMTAGNS